MVIIDKDIVAGQEYTITHNLGMVVAYTFVTEDGRMGNISVYDVAENTFTCKSAINGTLHYLADYGDQVFVRQTTQSIKAGTQYTITHNLGMVQRPTFVTASGEMGGLQVYNVTPNSFDCESLLNGTLYYIKSFGFRDRVKDVLNTTSLTDQQIDGAIEEGGYFIDALFQTVDISDNLKNAIKVWYGAHLCRVSERELSSQGFDGIAASFYTDEGTFLQKAIDLDPTNTLVNFYRNRNTKNVSSIGVGY